MDDDDDFGPVPRTPRDVGEEAGWNGLRESACPYRHKWEIRSWLRGRVYGRSARRRYEEITLHRNRCPS